MRLLAPRSRTVRRWDVSIVVLLAIGVALACVACAGGSVGSSDTGTSGTGAEESVFFPMPSASAVEVRLARVIDGDTIRVYMPDGKEEKVRYIGIDTPEMEGEDGVAEYLAHEATARNQELLAEGPILLETDVSERDRFGRLLAYVWAGDVFVNGQLALEGYARVFSYKPNLKFQPELKAVQQKAQDAGVGVWGGEGAR